MEKTVAAAEAAAAEAPAAAAAAAASGETRGKILIWGRKFLFSKHPLGLGTPFCNGTT